MQHLRNPRGFSCANLYGFQDCECRKPMIQPARVIVIMADTEVIQILFTLPLGCSQFPKWNPKWGVDNIAHCNGRDTAPSAFVASITEAYTLLIFSLFLFPTVPSGNVLKVANVTATIRNSSSICCGQDLQGDPAV